ncbi:hypothetical protein NQ317_000914 [Molorchus minor]|uniref:Uncharacterized protein n=1 Tax=Molorchus minor TaxID=1323400 RepID=A0ABQ9K0K1_9CUCU|nr:hypothetical protein NQ317_000914 [Molorchus minor]
MYGKWYLFGHSCNLFIQSFWGSNFFGISATDCVNGTIYETKSIPRPYITFRQFWNLTGKHRNVVDPNNQYVPALSALTIYNNSRLYINLDGCVNTLKGECFDFLQSHGRDGRNQTSQSRYTCFYNKYRYLSYCAEADVGEIQGAEQNPGIYKTATTLMIKNNSFMVVARFDLKRTWRDLIIAISIPSVLFVVSFITLCAIMQSVRVDDDTKMRCKYCFGGGYQSDMTEMISNKYEMSSPESDGPFNRRSTQEILS